MICAYLRVSTRSQSLATQRAAIRRAASARGEKIGRWYAEIRSGSSTARPELDRIVREAHAGVIRHLYVHRVDRLTRRGVLDTLAVVETLRAHGCRVTAAADAWFDLEGPFATLILAVMGWAAEQELAAIRERVSSARERVRAEGGRWGRPPRCNATQVAKIGALASAGRSHRAIAIALKIPRPTVTAVLARKGPYGAPAASSQKRLARKAQPPAAK